jgi:hypothetical protein
MMKIDGADLLQQLAAQRRHRHRRVLQILDRTSCRSDDFFERTGWRLGTDR